MQEFTALSRLGQQPFSMSVQLHLTPPAMHSPEDHTMKM